MITDLNNVGNYSKQTNLIFNAAKTKSILFATRQMIRRRGSNPNLFSIKYLDQEIERTSSFKVLGITFTEDLSWNEHIKRAMSSSYAHLRTLTKIKRYTPFRIRKQLAEALVLSRIDYGNAVFHDAPDYLKNRIQKIINASAAYVRGRYSKTVDTINLE